MSRLLQFFLFFTIFSGVMFGIHYFIFQIIAKNLSLTLKTVQWIKWIFIISGISIIAGQFMSRLLHIHFVQYYGYIWLGLISITFSMFIIASLLKIFVPPSSGIIVMSAIGFSILISIYSLANNFRGPVITEIEIVTTKSIGDKAEFRIVQLTDVHLDQSSNPRSVKRIVDMTNSLSPHLIVITGDLIDGVINKKSEINKILSGFSSDFGVFAITGNHEYYSGINNFIELTERTGIEVLFNKYKELNQNIGLFGLTDETSSLSKNSNWDADILNGLDKTKFNILIGHRPYGIEQNSKKGVDLQLAGHTHAGQIPPMDLLVQLLYRYPHGLYRSGNSFIYTSSGTGIWGPPMRFLSRSEIILCRIRTGKNISGRIAK